jgi:hypothetical protein
MASTVGAGGGGSNDDKVVPFPKTAEERRAHPKAKQDLEKQRLINVFIDESGGDQALFHTRDDDAYADLIVSGHRETWPVRSKQFRHAYLRYLQRQFDRLVNEEDPMLAMAMKASMGKTQVNHAIDDFERCAICSTVTRDVFVRVAGHNGALFIDLCNDAWEAVQITAAGWHVVTAPPVRFQRTGGMLVSSISRTWRQDRNIAAISERASFGFCPDCCLFACSALSAWTLSNSDFVWATRLCQNQFSAQAARPC